jgi:hypothetical protein
MELSGMESSRLSGMESSRSSILKVVEYQKPGDIPGEAL